MSSVKLIAIDHLHPTQLYLSQRKLDAVRTWLTPSLLGLEPVPVRAFLDSSEWYLTDGHTRTFAAWQAGVTQIPCVYDECDLVACELGQILYKKDIEWCERFHLRHISTLADRIVPEEDYRTLWQGRCEKMYNLEAALLQGKIDRAAVERMKAECQEEGLFVYGISEDYTIVYCENASGELFNRPW